MYTKSGGKEFFELYVCLLSYPLASAGGLGPQVGFDGACELRSQKDIVRFQKFFLP